jgi:hypothetical protein
MSEINEKNLTEKTVIYKVKVDNIEIEFTRSTVLGEEILKKAGRIPVECFSLYEKLKGCDFEKISLHEKVDLSRPGIEHFVTKPPEVFHYTVDGEPETTDESQLTANQILKAAGYNTNEYYLVQINDDGTQISYENEPEKFIKMKCPGLKFIALYRSSTPVS